MTEASPRSLLPRALQPGRGLALTLVALWSGVIWWGLLTDKVGTQPLFPGSGYVFNLAHAGIFGLEALLLGFVFVPSRAPSPGRERLWWLAAALALAYSCWLEWEQGNVDGRSRSVADLVTNTLGIWGLPRALGEPRPGVRWWLLWLAACALSAGVATTSSW